MTATTPYQKKDRPDGINVVGTIPSVAGLTVEEFGYGPARQTKLTLVNVPILITDSLAYASQKVYDFPDGRILVKGCTRNLAIASADVSAGTGLNSAAVVSTALGTAAASNLTLSSTMVDLNPAGNISVGTANNVAGTAVGNALAASAQFDGTGTAKDMYLNLAVTTNTEIDADAYAYVTGTIIFNWENLGDY